MSLLLIENLKKYFPVRGGLFSRTINHVKAVNDVSFSIEKGETFGLVGESGCGKTTLGRTILRLLPATSGKVFFDGQNILDFSHKTLRKLRKEMQIVFQDPFWALNPRMTVKDIVAEPLKTHLQISRGDLEERISKLLDIVGLTKEHLLRYPHELSGGQKQRIGIARAIALNPQFLILDEPTSALDVSVQAQILNLLRDLQKRLALTYLFISHDLTVVQHLSNRIGVMYLGELVEIGNCEDIFSGPLHPYAKALISATPIISTEAQPDNLENTTLKGEVPSMLDAPPGCNFGSRCQDKMSVCKRNKPILIEAGKDHYIKCHLYS